MKNTAGLLFFVIFLLCSLTSAAVAGEPDTSILIQGVTVALPRSEQYREVHRVITLDTALVLSTGDESVGTLLQRMLPVTLMEYGGAGALTTLALRGVPAAQTQVNWNGFPLNSPTGGLADLSLLQAGMFEHISLIPGAPGSLYGSGTAGGALNLDNRPLWRRRFSLTAGAGGGSFGTWEGRLTAAGGAEKIQNNTSLFYRRARNDYPYRDDQRADAPIVRAEHNTFSYAGIMHNTYARLRRDWLWQGGLWLQGKHKEIPAPMGSLKPATAMQRDSSLRLYNAITKHGTKSLFSARAAWFFENMRYTDKTSPDAAEYSIDSRFRTSTLLGDIYYKYMTRHHLRFDAGVAASLTTAQVTNYTEKIGERSLDLYGGAKYIRDRWRATATLRQSFRTGASVPPQGEAGFLYHIVPELLTLHGTVSTHYRVPTLNDKYWVPGGNPSLRPEHGWSVAGGADVTLPRSSSSWRLSWQGDGYYNLIKDQIRWVPAEGYWQPENVEEVRSRGMDNSLRASREKGRLALLGVLNYNLTFSSVTSDAGKSYESRYIPRHSASATLRAGYGIFFSGIYLNYSGKRYTTTDNDPLYALDPYLLTTVVAGIKAGRKKTSYLLQFTADNLFNVQYQVIRSYAMPGRAFYLKAVITFETN